MNFGFGFINLVGIVRSVFCIILRENFPILLLDPYLEVNVPELYVPDTFQAVIGHKDFLLFDLFIGLLPVSII